jgi:hypothetical protein
MTEKELRQKFVNKATSYVGVKEGSSKHKYIVDTYNKIKPLPQGYKVTYKDSWCATFVSFCAAEAGLLDYIPAECSCNRQIALWKKLGRWEEKDSYVPKIGDVLYYSWNDNGVGDCTLISDHVGIVVSINGSNIKVIEGNYSDSVKYRIMPVNGKFIRGYGKPDFASKATGTSSSSSKESAFTMKLQTLKSGDNGEQVKALQILLMGRGYSLPKYGADGDYGNETVQAVKAFQKAKKIPQDGIAGKDTFSRLLLG